MSSVYFCRRHIILVFCFVCNFALGTVNLEFVFLLNFSFFFTQVTFLLLAEVFLTMLGGANLIAELGCCRIFGVTASTIGLLILSYSFMLSAVWTKSLEQVSLAVWI